jgi:hypothetical protein
MSILEIIAIFVAAFMVGGLMTYWRDPRWRRLRRWVRIRRLK